MDVHANQVLVFLIPLILIIGQVSSQTEPRPVYDFCIDDAGNYTAESTYETNLHLLLSNLKNLASSSLFSNHTVGEGPDQAYGLYMCRGDFTSEECDTCVGAASTTILEKCPVQKEAIMWYEDCMVRYANRNIFSLGEIWPVSFTWSNTSNVSNPLQFGETLAGVVNDLMPQGAYNSSSNGYAAARVNITLFEDLYVLIQCTPDVLGAPCERCLKTALRNIGICCDTLRTRTSMYLPSCWLRYSNLPLFRELETPPTSPSPPPSSPPPPPRPPFIDHSDNSDTLPVPPPPGGSNGATATSHGICFMFGLMMAVRTFLTMLL